MTTRDGAEGPGLRGFRRMATGLIAYHCPTDRAQPAIRPSASIVRSTSAAVL